MTWSGPSQWCSWDNMYGRACDHIIVGMLSLTFLRTIHYGAISNSTMAPFKVFDEGLLSKMDSQLSKQCWLDTPENSHHSVPGN